MTDTATNPLAGTIPFIGDTYTIDRTAPTGFDVQGDPSGGQPQRRLIRATRSPHVQRGDESRIDQGRMGQLYNFGRNLLHFDTGGASNATLLTFVASVNLGSIDLGDTTAAHYVSNHGGRFDVTSTMTMATVNGRSVITIQLSGTGGNVTGTATPTMLWTPDSGATRILPEMVQTPRR